MSAIDIARAILAANSTVTSAAQGGFHPVELPQNVTLPAVVLHLVNDDDGRNLTGTNGYPLAGIIVDSVAESFGAASILADKIKAALNNYSGTIGGAAVTSVFHNGLDLFDRGGQGGKWRRRLGFDIRYRLA
ncbi:hypothetical protein ASD04_00085 [Devosia sp. Root436]|uniref:tail completion protein gp17 n=1 Tax=Devosia sp. Root436 TaxID=1736537 RepID=UPI0006FB7615|nr:DUF3168 domain-containing protein [Devosia sp. Root436]KQX42408.1 hypothetical protein ASD04_00085 [Devosia sp. Root436]